MKLPLITTIAFAAVLTACATTKPANSTSAETAQKTAVSTPTQSVATQAPEKIAKNMQSVSVTSNPEGATCVIKAGDKELGTVASTPENIVIKRMNWKFGADVTCSKEGFETKTGRLANNPAENQMGGNIGAIFNAVKMIEGSLSAWNDSVFVSLDPSYFTSTTQRDEYLTSQTALLNSNFTNASEEYLTCKRKKCKRKLEELQSAYDVSLAKLNADVASIPVK